MIKIFTILHYIFPDIPISDFLLVNLTLQLFHSIKKCNVLFSNISKVLQKDYNNICYQWFSILVEFCERLW